MHIKCTLSAWTSNQNQREWDGSFFVAGAVVSKPKVEDAAPVSFTPTQITTLLASSPAAAVPYFAIGTFAGLRPEEMKRLDWSQIDFDANVIEVTGRQAKTSRRRLVDISDNPGAEGGLARRAAAVLPAGHGRDGHDLGALAVQGWV